ncbi:PepSY domain-containing protein [Afifella pfennigii]|uniref:PepSY domain-containing protein n=1 Tax=Afifella pfennigii TaxID=209897 RepID=UPI00146FA900|nr:PepSY domain-containing protein [Afifella pfennigii]
MKKKIAIAALLAAAIGVSALGTAQASADDSRFSRDRGSVTWMPITDLVSQLEALGYTVLEVDREDGRYWDVKMTDTNGMQVEAELDAATGAPISGAWEKALD